LILSPRLALSCRAKKEIPILLKEIARVLKPGGLLAVVEFKKIEPPPGPPAAVRLRPEDVATIVSPQGFKAKTHLDLGVYHYLSSFVFEP
jgi:ubiquinone/menaquinone biosynthesis C-methylase UbiE